MVLLLTLNNNLFGCSCIGKKTVKESFKESDLVFKGEAVSKEEIIVYRKLVGTDSSIKFYFYKYTFEVKIVYKGKVKLSTIQIITGIGKGDCGSKFVVGREYIVYSKWKDRYYPAGDNVDKFLYTNICTRTTSNINVEQNEIEEYRRRCRWVTK